MTLFAGIIARGQTYRAPPEQAVEALRGQFCRQASSEPRLHRGPTHAYVSLELGIFEGASVRAAEDGPISLFGWDPLIDRPAGDGAVSSPGAVRGSFCAAQILELLPRQLRAIEYSRRDELPTVGATEDEAVQRQRLQNRR